MFTIIFVAGLIVLGATIYLWVGLYRELSGVEPDTEKTRPFRPRPKPEVPVYEEKTEPLFEDAFVPVANEEWARFDTVERDASPFPKQESHEDYFFEDEPEQPSVSPVYQPKEKDLTIEERYAFLLDDEEVAPLNEEEEEDFYFIDEEDDLERPEEKVEEKVVEIEAFDFDKLPLTPFAPASEEPKKPQVSKAEEDIEERLRRLAEILEQKNPRK